MNHEYELIFRINTTKDPQDYLDALFEAGCNDCTIGIGASGRIAFMFDREAESYVEAVSSALKDVRKVFPNAELMSLYDFSKEGKNGHL